MIFYIKTPCKDPSGARRALPHFVLEQREVHVLFACQKRLKNFYAGEIRHSEEYVCSAVPVVGEREGDLEVKKEDDKPTAVPEKAAGTILVIEDEEIVMEVIVAMLENLGYRTIEAKTGSEAVNIVRTFEGEIGVSLLDIKLPDMEGGKAFQLIKEAKEDLRVIVCSGYALAGAAQEILDAGAQGFMQKPYSLATLSETLKKVLAEA